MRKWTRKHAVEADVINDIESVPRGAKLHLECGEVIDVDNAWIGRHRVEVHWVLVRYPDGYLSACPAEKFFETHDEVVLEEDKRREASLTANESGQGREHPHGDDATIPVIVSNRMSDDDLEKSVLHSVPALNMEEEIPAKAREEGDE